MVLSTWCRRAWIDGRRHLDYRVARYDGQANERCRFGQAYAGGSGAIERILVSHTGQPRAVEGGCNAGGQPGLSQLSLLGRAQSVLDRAGERLVECESNYGQSWWLASEPMTKRRALDRRPWTLRTGTDGSCGAHEDRLRPNQMFYMLCAVPLGASPQGRD